MAEQRGHGDRNSGGSATVEFSDVAGWTKPGNQAVTINKGQTTTVAGPTCSRLGSLQVTIGPQGAIERGEVAPWGTAHGETVGPRRQGSVGQQTVEFSDVTGWTKPGNQAVTINKGQTRPYGDLYDADGSLR